MTSINPITRRDPNSTLLKGKPLEFYQLLFELLDGVLYRRREVLPVTLKVNRGNFYPRISVKGVGVLKAHRLVFFLKTGREGGIIDHIDGDKANFHTDNLRETNNAGNQVARYSKVVTTTNSANIDIIKRKLRPPLYSIRFGGSKAMSLRFRWPVKYSSLSLAERIRDNYARKVYDAFCDTTRVFPNPEKQAVWKSLASKIKEKYPDTSKQHG
jgi:HNH endonuclease